MMNISSQTCNLFQEKCYIVEGSDKACVIVDPGLYTDDEKNAFFQQIASRELIIKGILLTHSHFDHIFGVKLLQDKYNVPVFLNPEDKKLFDFSSRVTRKLGLQEPDTSFKATDISEGQTIELAGLKFEVIFTPGHTPGGTCYLEREHRVLFTGDTLFAGTIGRTDFDHGDYDAHIKSIMM